jgi:hypothetical protein
MEQNNPSTQIEAELKYVWPKIKLALRDANPRLSELDAEYTKALVVKLLRRSEEKFSIEKQRMALSFLDDAKDALKLSRLLYSSGMLADSIFNLQQSVEKACKSLGLAIGTLETTDMRSIGHKSPKVFIKLLKEPITREVLPLLKKFGLKEEKENIQNLEEMLNSNSLEFALLSYGQLKILLSIVNKMKEEVIPQYKIELNKVKEIFLKYLRKYEHEIVAYDMSDFLMALTSLWVTGAITYAHEQTSRYSDTPIIKREDYTLDMPIVRIAPELHVILSDTLTTLERYIVST